jgi:hypothetical protein
LLGRRLFKHLQRLRHGLRLNASTA